MAVDVVRVDGVVGRDAAAQVRGGRGEVVAHVRPLDTGPAIVGRAADVGHADPVDLLPGVVADVTHPYRAAAGGEGDPERVAEAVGQDALGVGVRAAGERVPGCACAARLEAHERAVQERRAVRPADGLGPQGAALARRRRQAGAGRGGRVAARVGRRDDLAVRVGEGAAVLAVVLTAGTGVQEAGALAHGRVQVAVRAEYEVAHRVAGELLAVVGHEHGLCTGAHVAAAAVALRGQPRDTPLDGAAVRGGSRCRGARIIPLGRRVPRGVVEVAHGVVVVRVHHVHRRVGREVRRERHAQQAAVPVVVDLRGEVGERMRRVAGGAGVVDDAARLLGHEHHAVGGEAHHRRIGQPREDGRLGEAGRQRGCRVGAHRSRLRRPRARAEQARRCRARRRRGSDGRGGGTGDAGQQGPRDGQRRGDRAEAGTERRARRRHARDSPTVDDAGTGIRPGR